MSRPFAPFPVPSGLVVTGCGFYRAGGSLGSGGGTGLQRR